MFLFNEENGERKLVEGPEFEGQGLKKGEVVKHLQELRALGYSIINSLLMANAKLAGEYI